LPPQQWELEQKPDVRWFQSSLRNSSDIEPEPGSELPGYSQISLREQQRASLNNSLVNAQNHYEKLIATNPKVERKGATMPYTSVNGHMR
jgi:hypothetical protein